MPLGSKINGDLRVQILVDEADADVATHDSAEWYDVAQYQILGLFVLNNDAGAATVTGSILTRFEIGDDDLSGLMVAARNGASLGAVSVAAGTNNLVYVPLGEAGGNQSVDPEGCRAFEIKGRAIVGAEIATRAMVAVLLKEV